MKYSFNVHFHEQGMTQPGDKRQPIPMQTAVEGKSKEEALAAFFAKHPKVIQSSVKVGEPHPICETYEELAEWLKKNKVAPEKAMGAVQCMVINNRPENIQPFNCPDCGFDLNIDMDHHDNAYFCPNCKALIQTG